MGIKINWVEIESDWAFGNLCKHMIKKMLKHKHSVDDKKNNSDINFVCSPNFLRRGYMADHKTVLLLPGFRIFGDIGLEKRK